ncbi:hypothetical protein Syun_001133 [Stephania yunnanensis]|uniref:Uncharacterized protein n=1 Tax=Stephania yunnanensis TaxID=152371 RepID=A0AAP0LEA3_9MAGN
MPHFYCRNLARTDRLAMLYDFVERNRAKIRCRELAERKIDLRGYLFHHSLVFLWRKVVKEENPESTQKLRPKSTRELLTKIILYNNFKVLSTSHLCPAPIGASKNRSVNINSNNSVNDKENPNLPPPDFPFNHLQPSHIVGLHLCCECPRHGINHRHPSISKTQFASTSIVCQAFLFLVIYLSLCISSTPSIATTSSTPKPTPSSVFSTSALSTTTAE